MVMMNILKLNILRKRSWKLLKKLIMEKKKNTLKLLMTVVSVTQSMKEKVVMVMMKDQSDNHPESADLESRRTLMEKMKVNQKKKKNMMRKSQNQK